MSNFIRMSERDFRDLLSIPEKSQRIVDILESYPIPSESSLAYNDRNPLGPSDYMSIMESLLKSLYGEIEENENFPGENEWDGTGATYILNERATRIWHAGIKRISFISLYPNSIIKLIDTGELSFSVERMGDLFRDLLETRKILKQKAREHYSQSQLLIKVLINMTYGMFAGVGYTRPGLSCRGMNRVPEWSGKILRDLAEKETRNIVSVDVDDIYLYEINDRVLEALKTIDIPYEVSDIAKIMWVDKKKLVELDSEGKIVRNTIGTYKRGNTYGNLPGIPHFGKDSAKEYL